MYINKFAKFLIPLILAIGPIPALCHESADLGTNPGVTQFSESERAAILQEIKVFAQARITARRAIAIAERRGAGAKVVDLSFDGTSPRLAYRVKVLLNEELWEGTIDASTGMVVGDGATTTSTSKLGEEDKAALAAFSAAGIDLSETIAIAEEYGSGKAVSAGLQQDGAKLVMLVVLVSDGSLKEISVQPRESRSRQRKASAREMK